VQAGNIDMASVNIARLLYSLDANPVDAVVTIPAEVRARAVQSNESLSGAIVYLDFSDEQAFVNAATRLVAVLTNRYPYTATLPDAQGVRDGMLQSPDKASGR